MTLIAENCDSYTSYYWKIAVPTTDCPNWIAKWFLYHKFRYRDGRNKNSAEDRGHTPHRHNGSHHSRSQLQNSRHPYVATEYRTSFEGTVSVGMFVTTLLSIFSFSSFSISSTHRVCMRRKRHYCMKGTKAPWILFDLNIFTCC
jgi:hypothetical protein